MRAAVVTVCRIADCKGDRQLALHQGSVSASDQLKQPNDEADLFMRAGAQEGWAGHRCLTPGACRRRSRDDVKRSGVTKSKQSRRGGRPSKTPLCLRLLYAETRAMPNSERAKLQHRQQPQPRLSFASEAPQCALCLPSGCRPWAMQVARHYLCASFPAILNAQARKDTWPGTRSWMEGNLWSPLACESFEFACIFQPSGPMLPRPPGGNH